VVEAIGRYLGCLVTGGHVDIHRAAEAFLRELRAGKIGRVSLEDPATAAEIEADMFSNPEQVPVDLERF